MVIEDFSQRNLSMVVGICGGSASGKSTFSRSLSEHLSDLGPEILNQNDISEIG